MKRIVVVFVVCAVLAFAVTVLAQAPVKPAPVTATAKADPTLSEVDKLRVQNVLLRIELAQRTMQQAQQDFEKARADAQALIQGLQVPGFDLDLQALAYKPKAPAPSPEKK